jgi:hypothetical protein
MAGGSEQSRAGDRIDSASSQVSTPVRGADGGSAERAAVPVALTFPPPPGSHARRQPVVTRGEVVSVSPLKRRPGGARVSQPLLPRVASFASAPVTVRPSA